MIIKNFIFSIIVFSLSITVAFGKCDKQMGLYQKECNIQSKFRELKSSFQRIGVDINEITEYRSLRFIGINDFKPNHGPYYLPWKYYGESTWIQWEKGNSYRRNHLSKKLEAQIKRNNKINMTINDFKMLHKNVITKAITGAGDKNPLTKHFYPNPGQFRDKFRHIRSGFIIKKSWKIDKKLKGYIDNYDLKDSKGKPLVKVQGLLIRPPTGPYYVGRVVYASSSVVPSEMEGLVKTINSYINKYLAGIRQNISPMQFIADIQRRYVSIHPFHEGNGRMSRLLQDILLTIFDLPYLLSAYLQEDVINYTALYRKQTFDTVERLMRLFSDCYIKLKSNVLKPKCVPLYHPLKGDPTKNLKEAIFKKI